MTICRECYEDWLRMKSAKDSPGTFTTFMELASKPRTYVTVFVDAWNLARERFEKP